MACWKLCALSCSLFVLSLGAGFFPAGVVFQPRNVNAKGPRIALMNQILIYCHNCLLYFPGQVLMAISLEDKVPTLEKPSVLTPSLDK